MHLSEALASFNRKERYWLIRNVLGTKAEELDEGFRNRLGATLGINIPQAAWWAMDYHLNWLVGALHRYCHQDAVTRVQTNDAAQELVQGNQEDIDLIIAFDRTLIFVEAKGDTSWLSGQMSSKAVRLNALFDRFDIDACGLQVHLVLTSPKPAPGLSQAEQKLWSPKLLGINGTLAWIQMEMGDTNSAEGFWNIVRCKDDQGTIGQSGEYWKLLPPRKSE